MSEENNEKFSKITSDEESKNDDLSPISASDNIRADDFTVSQECIVESSSNLLKDEGVMHPPTLLIMEESKENTLTIESTVNSKTSTDSSSVIQTSDSTFFSTIPTTITSEYTTGSSFSTTGSHETSSSEGLNHHNIEESINKMIKHIEKEIASEEHVGLIENHFQDIEMKIKTSRVMVAIEQTIQKLEIAFCLPYIFVENMHDMNALCGDLNMSRMMNENCKIRDADDMDICRFQPAVINCINGAFEAGFSQFVDLHRKKVELIAL